MRAVLKGKTRHFVEVMGGIQMKKVIATYDKDSKKFHRFLINPGQELVGTIYVPKRKEIPKEVTITLEIKKQGK